MGAGRKTFSYDFDTRNETNYRFEQQQKNLGAQLGGVIFMCNSRTYRYCMDHLMFGLPSAHWCYVQYVREGMPLFLYNFETKELHGIFKAVSTGEWELEPLGWTDGSRRTPYPCQVMVAVYLQCPAVPLDQFRGIIAENYLGNTDKFQQELTKKQAAELCALFRRKLEGQGGGRVGPAGTWPSLGPTSGDAAAGGISVAAPQFVPSVAPVTPAWGGRHSAGANGHGSVAVDAEPPAGPPDLGGKTWAQIQEEEARRLKNAAKAAAKQQQTPAGAQSAAAGAAAAAKRPPSVASSQPAAAGSSVASASGAGGSGGGSLGAATAAAAAAAAAASRTFQQQQQQQAARPASQPAAAAAPRQQAPPVGAAPTLQHAAAAPAAGTASSPGSGSSAAAGWRDPGSGSSSSSSSSSSRPGVEELGDELSALKAALHPLITNMLALQLEPEVRVASALQAHLSRLDDHLMRVQKEQGRAVLAAQNLAAQVQQLQQDNSGLRQALRLATQGSPASASASAPGLASASGGVSSGSGGAAAAGAASGPGRAPAAAAAGSSEARAEDIYLLGGNDHGSAAHASGGGDDDEDGGGWLSSVLVYSPRTNSWRRGPEMPLMRGYGSCGVLGRHLYVMGGGNSHEWLSDCQRMDVRTGVWEPVPSMSVQRGCAGAAALGERLYVVGGGVADAQYDTVEIFNPEINAWMAGPKLRMQRFSTAAATLDGCIYVTGGYNGEYLQSAERLDPREGKWQLIPDMSEKRGAHACTAGPSGLLYVVGGYDVNNTAAFMASVEAFEPRMNAWRSKAPMQQGRAYGAVAYAAGMLWAMGGMQGDQGDHYNEALERYDAASDRWVGVAVPANVSTSRAFLTAGVVATF